MTKFQRCFVWYNNKSYIQWLATFAVFMMMAQVGFSVGWSSPNIAKLMSEDTPIHMQPSQISWLISIFTIGGVIGSIIGSLSIELIGSKKTIFLTFTSMSISWICLIIANSVEWLYTARFFSGLPISMVVCCFAPYVGEIAEPKIRGTLISISVLGTYLGATLSTIAETYLTMKVTSSIYLVQIFMGMALFIWLKDTPCFLVRKGNFQRAEDSIIFYHPSVDSKEELNEVKNFVGATGNQSILEKLGEFQNPTIKKSMFLIFLLTIIPHLTGFVNIISLQEVILENADFDLIKPKECVIYISIIGIFAPFFIVRLIDKLGRRSLLIISSVGSMIALIGLGIHFYLMESSGSVSWLPAISIFFFLTILPIGFGTVPSTVLSEIFPENMKSIAVGISSLSASFIGFIIAKIHQPIIDTLGEPYPFWIYALLSFIGLIIALTFLPETKGKTFLEIQNLLHKKNANQLHNKNVC